MLEILDKPIPSDLAFLLPITTLLVIGMIVMFILDLTDKRSRRKQLRLPFEKKRSSH
jgi:hypothetical protein